ncbi:MAG: 2Fe-2S iron-sulfur cluster binding domain-containing protein [Leptospiraceae bacterium]|nr:2Fe-2S iron-sulfur cluster binding domain-containing protein [Leptospiraceae bacterium]MCK6381691.1 2Fe-2S iron-sulfur cluster binding domain-containing protein [Leptospiraceae bacterium]
MLTDKEKSYALIFGENWKENLVPIRIAGKEYFVPSKISLLRAFHFISMEYDGLDLSLQKHCWAGTCENCMIRFKDTQMGFTKALACQMECEKDLEISEFPFTMKKRIQ